MVFAAGLATHGVLARHGAHASQLTVIIGMLWWGPRREFRIRETRPDDGQALDEVIAGMSTESRCPRAQVRAATSRAKAARRRRRRSEVMYGCYDIATMSL